MAITWVHKYSKLLKGTPRQCPFRLTRSILLYLNVLKNNHSEQKHSKLWDLGDSRRSSSSDDVSVPKASVGA